MPVDGLTDSFAYAIKTIAGVTVQGLKLDKTIVGIIKGPITTGLYEVIYDGGSIKAYAEKGTTYRPNSSVYILVPEGNMSNRKTIIGLTSSTSGESFNLTSVSSALDGYSIISNNILTPIEEAWGTSTSLGVSSFKTKGENDDYQDLKALYRLNDIDNSNYYSVDNISSGIYAKEAAGLMLSANFHTSLSSAQVYSKSNNVKQGDYGLILSVRFKNDTNSYSSMKEKWDDLVDETEVSLWQENEYKDYSLQKYREEVEKLFDIKDTAEEVKNGIIVQIGNLDSYIQAAESFLTEKAKELCQNYSEWLRQLTEYSITDIKTFKQTYYEWFTNTLTTNGNSAGMLVNYVLGANNMVGDPYRFNNGWSYQFMIQGIDMTNFVGIEGLYLYCNDFTVPVGSNPEKNTIKVKDIQLFFVKEADDKAGDFSLNLKYPQGRIFKTYSSAEQLIVQGTVLYQDNNDYTSRTSTIWFRENPSIQDTSDPRYDYWGGIGWERLPDNQTDLPAYARRFSADENQSYENKYLCVSTYNLETFLKKEFVLYNYAAKRDVEIVSDSGFFFGGGSGTKTLTCMVNGKANNFEDNPLITDNHYRFSWQQTLNGNATYFTDSLSELEDKISKEEDLAKRELLKVQRNSIKNIKWFGNILTYPDELSFGDEVTVRCTVEFTESLAEGSQNWVTAGVAEATLAKNGGGPLKGYTIEIVNGSQVFQYNEAGASPCGDTYPQPYTPKTLECVFYDPSGAVVDPERYNVKWQWPLSETMLLMDSALATEDANGVKNLYVQDTCPIGIADAYDFNASNNQITCIVEYDGGTYYRDTTFFFGKMGENSTNATQVVAKISPALNMTLAGTPQEELLSLHVKPNPYSKEDPDSEEYIYVWSNGELNTEPALRLDLYRNNELISPSEYQNVKWSIPGNNNLLKNRMSVEPTSLETDSAQACYITYEENPEDIERASYCRNHVIKGEVSLAVENVAGKSEWQKYYSFYPMPVIIHRKESGYSIGLDKNKTLRQVMYNNEGASPQYNHNQGISFVLSDILDNEPRYFHWTTSGGITYSQVEMSSTVNPQEAGWWEWNEEKSKYQLTEDTAVDKNKNYYNVTELYEPVPDLFENINPKEKQWYEKYTREVYKPTEDNSADSQKKYYLKIEEIEYKEITDSSTEANPSTNEWYEKVEEEYVLTKDTTIDSQKTYYLKTITEVGYEKVTTFEEGVNPFEKDWYEEVEEEYYVLTEDIILMSEKDYFSKEEENYIKIEPLNYVSPAEKHWQEWNENAGKCVETVDTKAEPDKIYYLSEEIQENDNVYYIPKIIQRATKISGLTSLVWKGIENNNSPFLDLIDPQTGQVSEDDYVVTQYMSLDQVKRTTKNLQDQRQKLIDEWAEKSLILYDNYIKDPTEENSTIYLNELDEYVKNVGNIEKKIFEIAQQSDGSIKIKPKDFYDGETVNNYIKVLVSTSKNLNYKQTADVKFSNSKIYWHLKDGKYYKVENWTSYINPSSLNWYEFINDEPYLTQDAYCDVNKKYFLRTEGLYQPVGDLKNFIVPSDWMWYEKQDVQYVLSQDLLYDSQKDYYIKEEDAYRKITTIEDGVNPLENGWYEKIEYVLTEDAVYDDSKTYYIETKSEEGQQSTNIEYKPLTLSDYIYPIDLNWYEKVNEKYVLSQDISWDKNKKYYFKEDDTYTQTEPLSYINPTELSWYEVDDENVEYEIYIPIHLYLNTHGLTNLNSWDGNSVEINEDEKYVLAPQIGAGKKNVDDNTFTGLMMGIEKTYNQDNGVEERIGLLGYNHGKQSIWMDAESGKTILGLPEDDAVDAGNPLTEGRIELVPGGTSRIARWRFDSRSLYRVISKNQTNYLESGLSENRLYTASTHDNGDDFEGLSSPYVSAPKVKRWYGIQDGSDVPGAVTDPLGNWRYGREDGELIPRGPLVEETATQFAAAPKNAHGSIPHDQAGMLLSAAPTYLSIKGKPFGKPNRQGISPEGINYRDANTLIRPGDSLEVQIDPNDSSVFTIYAHFNPDSHFATNADGLYVDENGRVLSDQEDESLRVKESDEWYRIPRVGIDQQGRFYTNAVKDKSVSMSVGDRAGFGSPATAGNYTGAQFEVGNEDSSWPLVKFITGKGGDLKTSPVFISSDMDENPGGDEGTRPMGLYSRSWMGLYTGVNKTKAVPTGEVSALRMNYNKNGLQNIILGTFTKTLLNEDETIKEGLNGGTVQPVLISQFNKVHYKSSKDKQQISDKDYYEIVYIKISEISDNKANPLEDGFYEKIDYVLTKDNERQSGKEYYKKEGNSFSLVTIFEEDTNPKDEGYYEKLDKPKYNISADTTVTPNKDYYRRDYKKVNTINENDNPLENNWYEKTTESIVPTKTELFMSANGEGHFYHPKAFQLYVGNETGSKPNETGFSGYYRGFKKEDVLGTYQGIFNDKYKLKVNNKVYHEYQQGFTSSISSANDSNSSGRIFNTLDIGKDLVFKHFENINGTQTLFNKLELFYNNRSSRTIFSHYGQNMSGIKILHKKNGDSGVGNRIIDGLSGDALVENADILLGSYYGLGGVTIYAQQTEPKENGEQKNGSFASAHFTPSVANGKGSKILLRASTQITLNGNITRPVKNARFELVYPEDNIDTHDLLSDHFSQNSVSWYLYPGLRIDYGGLHLSGYLDDVPNDSVKLQASDSISLWADHGIHTSEGIQANGRIHADKRIWSGTDVYADEDVVAEHSVKAGYMTDTTKWAVAPHNGNLGTTNIVQWAKEHTHPFNKAVTINVSDGSNGSASITSNIGTSNPAVVDIVAVASGKHTFGYTGGKFQGGKVVVKVPKYNVVTADLVICGQEHPKEKGYFQVSREYNTTYYKKSSEWSNNITITVDKDNSHSIDDRDNISVQSCSFSVSDVKAACTYSWWVDSATYHSSFDGVSGHSNKIT